MILALRFCSVSSILFRREANLGPSTSSNEFSNNSNDSNCISVCAVNCYILSSNVCTITCIDLAMNVFKNDWEGVKIIFRKTERRPAIHSRHHQPSLMKTNCLPVSLFWIKQVKDSKKKQYEARYKASTCHCFVFW